MVVTFTRHYVVWRIGEPVDRECYWGEACNFKKGKPKGGRGMNHVAVWGKALQAKALKCEEHQRSHCERGQRALGESRGVGSHRGPFLGSNLDLLGRFGEGLQ